ncbi:hypothetical protein GCM10023078_41770 [Gibbsiella greigii]
MLALTLTLTLSHRERGQIAHVDSTQLFCGSPEQALVAGSAHGIKPSPIGRGLGEGADRGWQRARN